MRRIYIFFILILFSFPCIFAFTTFNNESLKYVISYKWGLIHKDAGEATLSLRKDGNRYNIMLTAKTKPWADKFYQVRDTLKGSIMVSDLSPLSYSKLTHERGEYKKDEIVFSKSGNVTSGTAKRYRYDKGKLSVSEKTFSATGPVFDMLSIFYYLRSLDYKSISKDKVYTATIFSGKQKETISIRSLGIEKIKMKDNTQREAYHIKFNFSRNGGKKSSEDMDTWISTTPPYEPLYLVGKLPVGEVRAYLIK